jgi:hypothetical protein
MDERQNREQARQQAGHGETAHRPILPEVVVDR